MQAPEYQIPIDRAAAFQAAYDGTQYDGLQAWESERDLTGKYVPLRNRKPAVRANLGKSLCNRVKAFTLGAGSFPAASIEDTNLQGACDWIVEHRLKPTIPTAVLQACVQGAVGITFGFVDGVLVLRTYPRANGWPVFDDTGELAGLVIRYAGYHPETGVACWFRGRLDSQSEVWETGQSSTGPWQPWKQTDHNFGFVPAVWRRHLTEANDSPDGVSLLDGLLDTLKAYDYALSRADRMLTYTADPQPVVADDNPQETANKLIKGPHGIWCIGKEGKVFYLEINGRGIELQIAFAKELRNILLELARVVISDPDKVQGGQMSGYALRMAHEVMIDLADDLRLGWDFTIQELICKILSAAMIIGRRGRSVNLPGIQTAGIVAAGYEWARATLQRLMGGVRGTADTVRRYHPWMDGAVDWPRPASVTGAWKIELDWGSYFDPSPEEVKTEVDYTVGAVSGGVITRGSGTRKIAGRFGVADVEEEVNQVEAQAGVDLLGR